jgi:hypothetical protein
MPKSPSTTDTGKKVQKDASGGSSNKSPGGGKKK